MARVDYTGVPDASPDIEAPSDYQHVEASPASFGAPLAEGLGDAAQGAWKLADALNDTKVLGASNSLADFAADQQKTFRSLQGQAAIDAYPQYKQALEQKQQEIASSMPTVSTQNMFNSNSRRFVQGALDDAGEHIAGETLKLQNETALGQIQATKNLALTNRNQPGALSAGITTTAQQTADYMFKVKGIRDPDAIHAAVQQNVSSLVGDAVSAALYQGDTVADQQRALKNAQSLYKEASTSSIPGSPNVPILDAATTKTLGEAINYREWTVSQRADREQEKAAVGTRVAISNQLSNYTAMVERGVQVPGHFPTDGQIDSAYPNNPEQAQVVKEQRDTIQNMNYFAGVVPGATPDQVAKLRLEVQPDPNHPETFAKQARIAAAFDATLNARQKALSDDPASYVISTNPEVQRAWNAAQHDSSQFDNYAHAVQTAMGTTGVPSERQSLLPAPMAKGLVQSIETDPAGAPGKITQMEAQFGAHWPQVWRDLVQRGGLSPQYQAVGLIDPGNGALLARALSEPGKSGKDVSELLPKGVVGKISSSVTSNPSIMSLSHSLLSSGSSADQVASMQGSVRTLAYANMAYKGMDAGTALSTAVKAFTGQYRFVPNGGARVPSAQFDTVMQNAKATLLQLNPGKISLPGDVAAPSGGGFHAPVNARITSGFGERAQPIAGATTDHMGVDYGVPTGTPVAAAADGQVVSAGPKGGYGNAVVIRHADGSTTLYGHLSVMHVKPGDEVHGGQNIAASGATGVVTGPHLHFAHYDAQGRALNPTVGLGAAGSGGGSLFGQLGGPSAQDYVHSVQAAPSWITSPNADALWLVDHYGRVVRQPNGKPVSVPFGAPPPVPVSPRPGTGASANSTDVGGWTLH